ncbi:hypothetical protein ACFL0X_02435 [Nanoarchaeota archaeon]
MRKFSLILFILISILFISASNCPSAIEKTFHGTVSYNNELLQGNFEIRALENNEVIGLGEVSDGEYEISISPCTGSTGEIDFVINNIAANEKGEYNGESDWGKSEELDLNVNEMPESENLCGDGNIQLGEECDGDNLAGRDSCGEGWTGTISCTSDCIIDYSNCLVDSCGDGTCSNEETCSTCSTDCGSCSSSSSSGSSGGSSSSSSGGSSSSSSGGNDDSDETPPIQNLNTDNNQDNIENSTINLNSGITGSVTGAIKSKINPIIIFIALIFIIGIYMLIIKLRTKSEK